MTTINNTTVTRIGNWLLWSAIFVATLAASPNANAEDCTRTIAADVVVFDSPTVFNRLGAQNPNWITYTLRRDAIYMNRGNPTDLDNGKPLTMVSKSATELIGNVELRPDKRPRPLVIRSVAGACLDVEFQNLLDLVANPNPPILAQENNIDCAADPTNEFCALDNNDQVAGRCAGFHASGVELRSTVGVGMESAMDNDGSMVGNNNPTGDVAFNCAAGDVKGGLAGPGASLTYHLYTPEEGAFIINSYGALLGSEASSGNIAVGMFGALNVEPVGASMYRSQVTEEELRLATVSTVPSDCTAAGPDKVMHTIDDISPPLDETVGVTCNPGGQPEINYEATYPVNEPWISEGKAGLPILNMLDGNELVHSDINAIITGTGPNGLFPRSTYPLESSADNVRNPQLPNRLEPFREFTSQFHDEQTNSQVFPKWYNDPVLSFTLAGVKDQFMINYGSGGIGSEIIANRLHTGPMHDCTGCAYEEFFLSSSTVGDPALLVNTPANSGIEQCDPTAIAGPSCWRDPVNLANGPIPGNYALYQEDPSNVHHAYTGDFTKIRNTHAGSFEQHIFHLHNHQWLFNPNDDNANYLDAQEIMPGSGHTYELANGGVGNRNKTAGDAIFHCHFYPHFAQGMWYHIRIMDVMETGSVLAVSGGTAEAPSIHLNRWDLRSGKPAVGARALPDGELPDGVPIPAIVPLPGKAMPHMPAPVKVVAVDRGGHSLLGGRTPPDGVFDSSQTVVDRDIAFGADRIPGTKDDISPGFPFWLAGYECGPYGPDFETLTGDCPDGITGQRMPTPPLDMLTEAGAAALTDGLPPFGTEERKDSDALWREVSPGQAGGWDGGLPRHSLLGYVSGGLSADTQNRLDFRKVIELAAPVYYPETGTDLEKVNMAYQGSGRTRPSVANNLGEGTAFAEFVQNGAPAVPGGPYQDPCIDDEGDTLTDGVIGDFFGADGLSTRGRSEFPSENPRTYKLANIQIDAVFNKVGYHYPQERIIALWEDVEPTINKQRPPEPLVMRFNTFDCGKILHTNLVPHEYELDDFQVRTPTDIIGQHIHLPKWDLTTGDGAANGWNYEDGALAPGIVRERIAAINHFNEFAAACHDDPNDPFDEFGNCKIPAGTLPGQLAEIDLTGEAPIPTIDTGDAGSEVAAGTTHLEALAHPFFKTVDGNPQTGLYNGARTVIQRILIDPIVNTAGIDRGLGLTFSHDHYGPSTFQQIGLYSTILAEPAGSTWVHNESGEELGTRHDGGPTTWQAAILPPAIAGDNTVGAENVPDHREFYFEMSDFQHAYEPGVYVGATPDGIPVLTSIIQPDPFNARIATAPALSDTWKMAVNPPLKLKSVPFPDIVTANNLCPGPLAAVDAGGVITETQIDLSTCDANGEYCDVFRDPTTGDPIQFAVAANADANGVIPRTNVSPLAPRPCVEAINISHSSMWVVNYRNEPVGLRVFDPNKVGPDGKKGAQADGLPGDLALAFQSRGDRKISELNTRFGNTPYPQAEYCANGGDGINCDRKPGDPFTPIMRAYENDHVKIKVQVGATEEQHQTTFHGLKWLSNGSGFGASPNSGWRNFQSHGISEQFSLQMPILPDRNQRGSAVDYFYAQDATRDGIWSGTWGILRSYGNKQSDLFELPEAIQNGGIKFTNDNNFNGVCPRVEMNSDGSIFDPPGKARSNPVPLKEFMVFAVRANHVLPNNLGVTIPANIGGDNAGGTLDPDGGTLVYNRRTVNVPTITVAGEDGGPPTTFQGGDGPLNDPTALMYVRAEDVTDRFIPDVSPDVEPIINGISMPDQMDDRCYVIKYNKKGEVTDKNFAPWTAGCPVRLRDDAPVEPMVIRANAGDCIEINLRNKLADQATEAGTNQLVFTSGGTPVFDEVLAIASGGDLVRADGTAVAGNVIYDTMPDLAGWQDLFWVVNRDLKNPVRPPEMHFFNNNLVRPSALAGLHAQLVEYDASRDDGVVVGGNPQSVLARPGGQHTYRYYAGHIESVFQGTTTKGNKVTRNFARIATPVEFGGTNLLSADRVKQPQKGLYGALIIEPEGACHPDSAQSQECTPPALELVADGQGSGTATRKTRAQVTVVADLGPAGSGGTYDEAVSVAYRIANLRWKNGTAVSNIHQGELGREGAEDSGHAGFNYGTEPSWFRFGLPPDMPFGNAVDPFPTFGNIPNVHAFFANGLTLAQPVPGNSDPTNFVPAIPGVSADGDPATPVFRTTAGSPSRMHVLNGASADRDATFILHGHVWQRDPHVCPDDMRHGLEGLCELDSLGSQALGLNPIGKYMGGEEGMGHVYGHWPILFNAGGTFAVPGDYLFRDYAPSGARNGMFGILRADCAPNDIREICTGGDGGAGGGDN